MVCHMIWEYYDTDPDSLFAFTKTKTVRFQTISLYSPNKHVLIVWNIHVLLDVHPVPGFQNCINQISWTHPSQNAMMGRIAMHF